jgi:hypothetical protein
MSFPNLLNLGQIHRKKKKAKNKTLHRLKVQSRDRDHHVVRVGRDELVHVDPRLPDRLRDIDRAIKTKNGLGKHMARY